MTRVQSFETSADRYRKVKFFAYHISVDRRHRISAATFGRRVDCGNGRRKAERKPIELAAKAVLEGRTQPVLLADISGYGARLAGVNLASVGSEILVTADPFVLFGTIAWVNGDVCGIAFDRVISDDDLLELRSLRGRALNAGLYS